MTDKRTMDSKMEKDLADFVDVKDLEDGAKPLSHFTKMAPIDIEFNDLTYSVPNGRRSESFF